MLIKIRQRWALPESAVTPQAAVEARHSHVAALRSAGLLPGPSRRALLRSGAAALLPGCGQYVQGLDSAGVLSYTSPYAPWFPVPASGDHQVPERPVTDELAATSYNNFYEFTTDKSRVWQEVGGFEIAPWTLQVDGLVRSGGTFGVEDLLDQFDMEERIYRFRCVEAWAMTVPWSGFPLHKLIEWVDPLPEATHIALISESRPAQMPGVTDRPDYPWPYFEGLRLDEAAHPLTMLVAGMYGAALPRQNGAPLRLIVPWKYGYKSIKSIVRITFTDRQPETFWNALVPSEYSFESNVDPAVPHPRWSQATERLIPDGEEVETLPYNGYAEEVRGLYG